MSVVEEVTKKNIEAIQKRINYQFSDPQLLVEAFTHRSYTNESSLPDLDNERLEFLGDSVLGLIVSQHLFRTFPLMREGELSRARSHIVREASLAQVGVELGLGEMVLLGRGELSTGGRTKASVIANTVEAVYGAVLVDGGMQAAEAVIRLTLGSRLSLCPEQLTQLDPKGRLQEMVQTKGFNSPSYILVGQSGPEHDIRFEVEVQVVGKPLARSIGRSKKEAASSAAILAMSGLLDGSIPWPDLKPEEVDSE